MTVAMVVSGLDLYSKQPADEDIPAAEPSNDPSLVLLVRAWSGSPTSWRSCYSINLWRDRPCHDRVQAPGPEPEPNRADRSDHAGPSPCLRLLRLVAGPRPSTPRRPARVGAALARRGLGLVYGGGRVGLMGIVADAVLAAGGQVVGVIPDPLATKESPTTA